MRHLRYVPLTFLAGMDGFILFGSYLLVFFSVVMLVKAGGHVRLSFGH